MAYTETRTVGYGTRVGNSFKQIGTGFLLFIAGTVLLWWNEGNYKKTADMLEQAQEVTVEMNNITKVSPEFEGQLVWASGEAATQDVLQDDQFPVSGNYMHLKRDVEYYQWVEHAKEERKDKMGGSEEIVTTYTYTKEWVSSPVNSSTFHDPAYVGRNKVNIEVESKTYDASNVTFGAYTFPDFFINSIGGYTPAPVEQTEAQKAEQERMIAQGNAQAEADSLAEAQGRTLPQQQNRYDGSRYTTQDEVPYLVSGNQIYYGRSMNSPQIGDVKITFEKVDPKAVVSILGKVNGNTFAKWKAKNGKTFSRLNMGKATADEMYNQAESENDMLKWGLRLLGVLLVIAGLKMIFGFLAMILKVIPFLASIMNFGVGLICTVVGIAWSLIVIGVAWLFYRPLWGVIILAIAGGLIAFFALRGRGQKQVAEPVPAGPQQPQGPQAPQQQWGGQQQMPQQPQAPQQQWGQQPQQPQAPQQQGTPWSGQQVSQQPQQPQQQGTPWSGQQAPQQPQQPQQGTPWSGQQVPQQPDQTTPWNGQAPQDPNNPQQ